MNTTRTPQQASIEAREAREAWERGEEIEFKNKEHEWKELNTTYYKQPSFNSPSHYWRTRRKTESTPPVITPGKWRMRNGEVVPIERGHFVLRPWRHTACDYRTWLPDGRYTEEYALHDYDLLTRVETKWRPWKPEEVPSGWLRYKKDHTNRRLIVSVNQYHIVAGNLTIDFGDAFSDYELLLPDGTYAPCGVEEVVR